MDYTMWRGVVGMVQPARRPGGIERLIRLLPEGIGLITLYLGFRKGSTQEFTESIPNTNAMSRTWRNKAWPYSQNIGPRLLPLRSRI